MNAVAYTRRTYATIHVTYTSNRMLHHTAAAADAASQAAAPPTAQRSMPWATMLGFAAAAAATTHATADAPPPASEDPYAPPTELHGMPESLVLYQYEVCPFCCKVKAFLDYYNVCQVHSLHILTQSHNHTHAQNHTHKIIHAHDHMHTITLLPFRSLIPVWKSTH